MRKKVGVKIFVGLMLSFMIILGISMKLNLDSQVDLYKSYLLMRYNYGYYFDKIREKFPMQYSEQQLSEKDILKEIKTEKFKTDFNFIEHNMNSYLFYTLENNDSESSKKNIILDSNQMANNYIYIYGDNAERKGISVEKLSLEQKISLRKYIDSQLGIDREKDECFITYVQKDNQLKYLKWGNESFGNKPENVTEGYITDYCILKEILTYDDLRQVYRSENILELNNIIERYMNAYSGDNSYVVKPIDIDDKTYFVMSTPYIRSGDDLVSSHFMIVNVNYNLRGYVFDLYLEQNIWLFVGAFVLTIIVSWLFSYMIAKPIKKVEKAALRIASQNFDEPLIVKSKDEIGSLAHSVDSMRIQLKETIENLHQEIGKVKNLESLRQDFINRFTHEMKTPLGIINGYSELIEEAKDEKEVNKYLNIINRETNRVNELILSMLKLSRLEAKKVELNKQDIDLEESVVSIVDEYEVLLMKKNIRVEVNVVESSIHADKELIETVIHNFLSNAIKHTVENHKIIIDIDNGVRVFNQGKPIDDNKLENIWYTFVTHDREGSGLGLAICRSILELHGFNYGTENQEDGTSFYFKAL